MIEDAERYRAQDDELAEKAGYRTALEEAIFTAQSTVKPDDTAGMTELEDLMDWLELDSETATLEDMKSRGRMVEDKFNILVKP